MAIDKLSKSNRLLQSRRYTHDSFTDSQEAFTSTLDINANEVYVDQALIPSTGLPFSGSAQSGSIYSVNGQNVMQYYYRAGLTRSDLSSGSRSEVWFLLSNSTASAAGIGGQLIDPNQQTNFISPKYGAVSLANANAEDATPGYGVKVFVSNSSTSAGVVAGDQVSVNNYTFDYKTGVLQFTTTALAPTTSQYVYLSGYQYKGRVLTDNITNVSSSIAALSASVGGGGGGSLLSRVDQLAAATASVNSFTASQEAKDVIISSYTSSMNSFSASISASVVTLQGTGTPQGVGTGNDVTFATLQTTGNATIGGDLTILGNTVTMNVAQLVIEDKLITLASGSTSALLSDGAGFEVAGANVSMSFNNTYSGFIVNTKVSASVFDSPTGSFEDLRLSSGSVGTSKRVMFRNEANSNKIEYVSAPTTSGDLLQYDGTNFVMSNVIDGGSF